ncbi:MAG: hypothetical protein IKW23_00405 [Kiritimatiellae bacterium]|nr:hypothetical protein [Kiritimatiellia bacterium]
MTSFLLHVPLSHHAFSWRWPLLLVAIATLFWLSLATLHLSPNAELAALLRLCRHLTGIPCDKLVHVGLYFVICLLLGLLFPRRIGHLTSPAWACLLASGLGLLLEVLQGALSYYGFAQRAFDIADALANLVGALIASLALAGYHSRTRLPHLKVLKKRLQA